MYIVDRARTERTNFVELATGGKAVSAIEAWKNPNSYSSVLESASSEIERIKQLYTFIDQKSVSVFLAEHPFLLPILEDMYPKVEPYFPDSTVALKIVESAETTDEPQLVAFITTALSPKEAVVRLDQLGDDWGLELMAQSHYTLCITLKYL